MQGKHEERRKRLYYAFMDLEKAFVRVSRQVVRWALRKSGIEEWLVKVVMALCSGASTMVRTVAGDGDSFDVKVGVHHGSVLSPLLIAAAMDVVSKEVRGGLPWELLYTDDLIQMAHTREELAKKLAAERACLDSKGMKVNGEKSRIMVGCAGMGVIQQTVAWL